MTVRVHKLAKELGVSSKELIEKLHKLKVDVKGHMSVLDDAAVALVKKELGAKKAKPRPLQAKAGTKAKLKKKAAPKPKVKLKKEPVIEKQSPEPVEEEIIIVEEPPKKDLKILKVDFPIAIKDLATKLQIKPNELIKRLLSKKLIVTINQALDEANAGSIAEEFGYGLERLPSKEELLVAGYDEVDVSKLKPRAPIVTFMGHVDHGKTSLLDMIRKTKVVDKEAGGITQHIGAYEVTLPKGKVTFLDTPGHAAFTAMRARGANATDVVVLVVAADDGIMPQTIEAIDHAKAANVPIVVAINKIDKNNINIDKVKKQLAGIDLNPEDWGGKTITVGVSAKTGQGIDDILELLILEAEMLELKADPDRLATGIVVEAELSRGKGPVATVLVSQGTLNTGDTVMVGLNYGKVKAMIDDKGR
ncbi:MAG: translation initiation factor IF-2, partial [Candidatus Omnitrophica bacterium]|nr:translation initiation factor IF-2 [Candidatus Omnitrophota bacterium]